MVMDGMVMVPGTPKVGDEQGTPKESDEQSTPKESTEQGTPSGQMGS